MELYNIYFLALVSFCGALAYHRHHVEKNADRMESLALPMSHDKIAATKFKRDYFSVYGLVVAADWLQVRNGSSGLKLALLM